MRSGALPTPVNGSTTSPAGIGGRLGTGLNHLAAAARGHHGRWWQVCIWSLLALVLLRVALTPVLKLAINHSLAHAGRFRGAIDGLSIRLITGQYAIRGLRLESQHPDGTWSRFLTIDDLRCTLAWRPLLHGEVVGVLDLRHPVLVVEHATQAPPPSPLQAPAAVAAAAATAAATASRHPPAAPPDEQWQDHLRGLIRLRIDLVELHDGELSYSDQAQGFATALTEVNGSIDALAVAPTGDHRATFRFTASTIGQGRLRLSGNMDPLAPSPVFGVQVSLEQVRLPEINPLTENFDHLTFAGGVFDGYAELAADGKNVKGYLKPMFHDLDIATFKDRNHHAAVRAFWKLVIAVAEPTLRNDAQDQHAAVIPISGPVGGPRTDPWATIGSTLRNAFIRALIPGFDAH
jgi:hypothetical protein